MSPARATVAEPDEFNPLAIDNLKAMLRAKLEAQDPDTFPPKARFLGAGVYALYYVGKLEIYEPLARVPCLVPIYVGKAEAGNSSYGEPTGRKKSKLFDRIVKHSQSVAAAKGNLSPDDFRVRYLPLDDEWIVLAERALLREYRPVVWNALMPGFGANAPGSARTNARSVWDTVHPGRARGGLCHRGLTPAEQRERIALGVRASTSSDLDDRRKLLDEIAAYKRPRIWKPGATARSQITVFDVPRFEEAMQELKLPVPRYKVAAP